MSLNEKLKQYDFFSTLSRVSALLTFPLFQANSYRIERLIYLIILSCKKSALSPTLSEIETWLNEDIDRNQEDPIEDVFVTNIVTPLGNYKIFQGLWASNDFFTQEIIDILYSKDQHKELLLRIFSLLKISNAIVERAGLKRWDYSKESIPQNDIKLPSQLNKEMNRVVFSFEDLKSLRIPIKFLEPFIFRNTDTIKLKNYGDFALEERPLILLDNKIIVALPNAIGPAIRKYVFSEFKKSNCINVLEKKLFEYEVSLTERPVISPLFCLLSKKIDHKIEHKIPFLKDWLVKYDLDKYLHVILFYFPIDRNKQICNMNQKISNYIDKVSNFCKLQSDFKEGRTLIVFSSSGLDIVSMSIDLTNNRKLWNISFIALYDFLKLSSPFDKRAWSLNGYLKFLSQKKYLQSKGMKFFSIDGDYNLYCLWHNKNCNLMTKNTNINTLLFAVPDIQLSLNYKARKALDIHVSKDINSQYFRVVNYSAYSYFSSITEIPVYISLYHQLFIKDILKIVVENKNKSPKWLSFKYNQDLMEVCHIFLNSGLGILYQKAVSEIEKLYEEKISIPLEVCLNFEKVESNDEFYNTTQTVKNPEFLFYFEKNIAEIKFSQNFLTNFSIPENKGEKEIIKNIIETLICLYEKRRKKISQSILNSMVNKVVNENVRMLHIFTIDPLHSFLHKRVVNFEYSIADEMFIKVQLLSQYIDEKPETVLKEEDAQNCLNNLFKKIVSHIQSKLKMLNRKILLHKLIAIHESGIYESIRWKKTIGAVLSLCQGGGEIAENKNRERDFVKKSCQFLLEIAICECPENEGKKVSNWDIDELLATSLLLIEIAMDSDILKNNLCTPKEIKIENNSEYTINKSFINKLTRSFIQQLTFDQYEDQRKQYKTFYEKKSLKNLKVTKKTKEQVDIEDAFFYEFGLSTEEVSQICNALFKIAIKQNSVSIETTVVEIKRMCEENNISHKTVMSFINSFSIFHRPKWKEPPNGFTVRDILPFKYNRGLSFNVKPLLAFGKSDNSKVFYGIGNLYMATRYILYQITEGNFPAEFFKSNEMKILYGKINNKKGKEFNKKVANKLHKLGWNIRENINIPHQTQALKNLGDIDILGWKKHQVLVVESKRLQPTRNTNEIINSLQKFRGKNNDLLQKHINRVNWIKSNLHFIKEIIGFSPDQNNLKGIIITNILIPSQYSDSLPIDSNSILQIKDLEDSTIENLFEV